MENQLFLHQLSPESAATLESEQEACEAEDFYVQTARTDKEAEPLIVQGFEYVATTPGGVMLFKKRK